MDKQQSRDPELARTWNQRAIDTYERYFGKPLALILWQKTVCEDEEFRTQASKDDLQTSYEAWLQGWLKIALQRKTKNDTAQHSWERQWEKRQRTPQEIEELQHKINEIVDWPFNQQGADFYDHVSNDKKYIYLMNVSDALDWVLGNIQTDDFITDVHLNLEHWRRVKAQYIGGGSSEDKN